MSPLPATAPSAPAQPMVFLPMIPRAAPLALTARRGRLAAGTGPWLRLPNAVLVGLGEHLVGTLKHKESGGDPEAFAKFFRQMKAKMPHKDNTVTM